MKANSMAATSIGEPRISKSGMTISASQIHRLEKKLKNLKDEYDSLSIKQLTNTGKAEDQNIAKKEQSTLEELKKNIKITEGHILEIRLCLKDFWGL